MVENVDYERLSLDALKAVKRFADHAEERNITVPLWAGVLWDKAIGKVNAALDAAPVDVDGADHGD